MVTIMPAISSLSQYMTLLYQASDLRPERCPDCGFGNLWCHGHYERKPERSNAENNPVYIYRFYCAHCHKTCSVLPEYIASRRWYTWAIQQLVLTCLLAGESINTVNRQVGVARSTARRWLVWLKTQCLKHMTVIRTYVPALGALASTPFTFWLSCFKQISLAQVMRLCHNSGISVP